MTAAATAGTSAGTAVLEVRGLTVTYANGARGVDGVDLEVPAGSIVAILGRNGAGKTSLLRGIAGFLRSEHTAVTGSITFHGHQLAGATPVTTHKRGLVFVPERDKVFPSLRVDEHLRLVGKRKGGDAEIGAMFGALARRRESRAGMLSGGERQMLALAMAFAQEPRLLLVDELSLGLAPVVVKDLMATLRHMTDSTGLPILIVEQDAAAAQKVADFLYVMDRGAVVWSGARGAISAADLSAKYLGVGT